MRSPVAQTISSLPNAVAALAFPAAAVPAKLAGVERRLATFDGIAIV